MECSIPKFVIQVSISLYKLPSNDNKRFTYFKDRYSVNCKVPAIFLCNKFSSNRTPTATRDCSSWAVQHF